MFVRNISVHAQPRGEPAVRAVVADGFAPTVEPIVADLGAPSEGSLALSGVGIDALGHGRQRQGVVIHRVLEQFVMLPEGGFPPVAGTLWIRIECFPVFQAVAFRANFESFNAGDAALVNAVHGF